MGPILKLGALERSETPGPPRAARSDCMGADLGTTVLILELIQVEWFSA